MKTEKLIDIVADGRSVKEAVEDYLTEITTSGSIATPPMPMVTQPLNLKLNKRNKRRRLWLQALLSH